MENAHVSHAGEEQGAVAVATSFCSRAHWLPQFVCLCLDNRGSILDFLVLHLPRSMCWLCNVQIGSSTAL